MKDFFSILNHLLQAYVLLCTSLLFKEKIHNLQVSRFVLTEAIFFAVPLNLITWKIFSLVGWDSGIMMPGSRLSRNRKVGPVILGSGNALKKFKLLK